jgi:hypothetical protein
MNFRKTFYNETGINTFILLHEYIVPTTEYVEWLEAKLEKAQLFGDD